MTKLFEKQQKLLAKVDMVLLASEAGIDEIWDPLKQNQDIICEVEKVTPLTNTKTIPLQFPRMILQHMGKEIHKTRKLFPRYSSY